MMQCMTTMMIVLLGKIVPKRRALPTITIARTEEEVVVVEVAVVEVAVVEVAVEEVVVGEVVVVEVVVGEVAVEEVVVGEVVAAMTTQAEIPHLEMGTAITSGVIQGLGVLGVLYGGTRQLGVLATVRIEIPMITTMGKTHMVMML